MLVWSFLSLFFWRFIFFGKGNRHLFLFFSISSIFLLSAFRDPSEGIDMPNYIYRYVVNSGLTFEGFRSTYFSGDSKDPFFWFVSWLIAKIGFSEKAWLSAVSLLFSFSVYNFVRKYAKFPLLTLVLIVALGYLSFSYSGIRQTVALSITLLATPFLLEEKRKKFTVLVLLASLFHASAIIFIIAQFLNLRLKPYQYLFAIFISLAAARFLPQYIREVVSVFGVAHYSDYHDRDVVLNFTGVLIYLLLFLFALSRFNQVVMVFDKARILYNLAVVGLFFQGMSLVLAEMFRVALYFNVFSIILVGWALVSFKNELIRIGAYFGLTLSCLALFFMPRI